MFIFTVVTAFSCRKISVQKLNTRNCIEDTTEIAGLVGHKKIQQEINQQQETVTVPIHITA